MCFMVATDGEQVCKYENKLHCVMQTRVFFLITLKTPFAFMHYCLQCVATDAF